MYEVQYFSTGDCHWLGRSSYRSVICFFNENEAKNYVYKNKDIFTKLSEKQSNMVETFSDFKYNRVDTTEKRIDMYLNCPRLLDESYTLY